MDYTIEKNTSISPKVKVPAFVGLLLTVVVAILSAITPDMYEGLGQWTPVIAVLIPVVISVITGYLTPDKARDEVVIEDTPDRDPEEAITDEYRDETAIDESEEPNSELDGAPRLVQEARPVDEA